MGNNCFRKYHNWVDIVLKAYKIKPYSTVCMYSDSF
jgi:hypothetical protein